MDKRRVTVRRILNVLSLNTFCTIWEVSEGLGLPTPHGRLFGLLRFMRESGLIERQVVTKKTFTFEVQAVGYRLTVAGFSRQSEFEERKKKPHLRSLQRAEETS